MKDGRRTGCEQRTGRCGRKPTSQGQPEFPEPLKSQAKIQLVTSSFHRELVERKEEGDYTKLVAALRGANDAVCGRHLAARFPFSPSVSQILEKK